MQNEQKDDFWDLEALLPRTQGKARWVSARREDTDAVSLEIGAPVQPKNAISDVMFEEHFVPPHSKESERRPEPLTSYTPEGSLLCEVRVYPWRTQYDYYEAFRRHALRFYKAEGKECPAVDFFSYMPQYNQMSNAQLAYYFWWRSEFRRGRALPCAFSYLLLYLYEVINLGDAIPPAEGQGMMLRLWTSYRETHPRLDALLREWLCDYSLLHCLPPPKLPQKQMREMLSGCTLKEFYVPVQENTGALATAMLLFCNNYDYTKSKFFTEESASDYHRVLRGAVVTALGVLQQREDSPLRPKGKTTATRDLFTGAICSFRQRRRIEVDYVSFSHTHELRYVMSDVLKYAENALRGARGIKSRLSIYALDLELRAALDTYLAEVLPKKQTRAVKAAAESAEYERRYDLPRVAPSPERAAEIEVASWQTTKRLVDAFEAPEEEEKYTDGMSFTEVALPMPPPPAVPDMGDESELRAALGGLAPFLALLEKGAPAAWRAFAAQQGLMVDAVVDKINTVAGDILGDILIEDVDGTPRIIEDYRDLLIEQGVL